jgi:hypothetical protein
VVADGAQARVSRRHARLRWDEGLLTWVLEPLDGAIDRAEGWATSPSAHHTGAFFAGEVRVRFTREGARPLRDAAFEEQLRSRWNEATAAVYRDWLLEREEPLGRWMSESEPHSWAASLLAPSQPLSLEWSQGFVISASTKGPARELRRNLADVLVHPLSRFLQTLELELDAFRPAQTVSARWSTRLAMPGLMEQLAPLIPTSLKVLRLSGLDGEIELERQLARLRQRAPQLEISSADGT